MQSEWNASWPRKKGTLGVARHDLHADLVQAHVGLELGPHLIGARGLGGDDLAALRGRSLLGRWQLRRKGAQRLQQTDLFVVELPQVVFNHVQHEIGLLLLDVDINLDGAVQVSKEMTTGEACGKEDKLQCT